MERFFSNPSNAPRCDTDTGITLISGPPCCGKTSLLFQFAVNRAAESGRGVVFICSKGRLESNPPFLSQVRSLRLLGSVVQVEEEQAAKSFHAAMASLCLNYVLLLLDILKTVMKSESTLLHFTFLTTSLLQSLLMILQISSPTGVISILSCDVNDTYPQLVDFMSWHANQALWSCQQRYGIARARDLAMVRALALCHNAIGHANAKLGTLGYCNLLLSDVHQGDTPRLLFIYQRWVNSIYTIRGKCFSDGNGSYILQNLGSSETGSKKARKAKYSIALQYLVLEETST
ncbi:hypothetical protein Zm00014a_004252 [Zea mays]|uniref:P-loop containing nucleoside triphosphate hydrolase superfamily protein n=1 Tax=Zea mays TaxID=4577 RepID=A0A3L6ETH3_MAIZE|nr:hypothetical protein Zm00014a_004252 [Zea mays]